MHIPFYKPDISEEEINEVVSTLRSGWITTGPKTKLLEDRITAYCGADRTVCLGSATAAMEMTLRLLGIGPGDEVITSAYTFTASASVITHVGAKIVFVDVAPGSFQMDPDRLAEAITERTKAIIPVDVGGVPCDYDQILKAVESKKQLFCPGKNEYIQAFDRPVVIADAAHSFGAIYHGKRCGILADFTCFSFHAVKNMTTAEGGAVTWRRHEGIDDEKFYQKLRMFCLHGQNKDALSRQRINSWEYDIAVIGYKCNMTDIAASIGLVQLSRTDEFIRQRKDIIRQYDEALLPLGIQRLEHFGKDYEGNGHLYLMRIPGITEQERNAVIDEIAETGICCNVHFKPLPMHTAYQNLGFSMKDYPNAYRQYANEITLPLYTLLQPEEVCYINESVKKALKKNRPAIPR